jgi:hypothetical protein
LLHYVSGTEHPARETKRPLCRLAADPFGRETLDDDERGAECAALLIRS